MVSQVHHSIDLKSSRFFQHSVMAATEKEAPNRLKLKISRVKSETLITESETKRPNHGTKRGPSAVLNGGMAKKQRLDGRVMQQCSALLKMLMTQNYSWVFNEPVDPVKLKIPDYLTIVSKPMDLGTIKSKLQKKLYVYPEDLAADIRLTFLNAMLYNPPHNDVHQMAKECSKIFEKGWEDIQSKLSMDRESVRKHLILEERASLVNVVRQDNHKKLVCHTKSIMSKTSSQSSLTETSCGRDTLKGFHKGTVNVKSFGSITFKSACNPAACRSCGSSKCSCTHLRDSFDTSSDLDYKRSSYRDSNRTCFVGRNKLDHLSDETANKHMGKSNPDSDGAVSAVDEENAHPSSCPPDTSVNTTTSEAEEGWESNICDEQLSPSKALRAALLRSRFADTILKARKTLLDNGDKDDQMRIKQEKERLEKKQCEEKARIEAKVKAAEAALRRREEAQLRMQRKREREAARAALEKVEKTVEICVNNVQIVEELEMLAGYKFTEFIKLPNNPLGRLGLFMKEDYLEDVKSLDSREDFEEGEIVL